jgi:hypothetical protein
MYKPRYNYGRKSKELTEVQKENLLKLKNKFNDKWFTEDEGFDILGKRTFYNLNVLKDKGFLDIRFKNNNFLYKVKVNNGL